jgi:hypothetical protein
MAKFRIKVNLAHPTGVINFHEVENEGTKNERVSRFTVNRDHWLEVDIVPAALDPWSKYLVVELVPTGETKVANVSDDSTVVRMGRVPVGDIPTKKHKGKGK